jgi:MFS family permease
MIRVFATSWALFIGMFMLMIGNGLQGTLLGLRGEAEGFSTIEISIVMSAYFLGFLFSSKATPVLIQRVGHVRVFAAFGSMVSAVLILYPVLTEPWAWVLGRVIIGFCFCGLYVTAESWLNDASDNTNRGQALSLYMIVQMAGIVAAQYIITLGDVTGFILFIIPSVLVSLAFAPILLSVRPVPAFSQAKPMSLKDLVAASPLASVGMFLLGGIFAAQFGMSAVYGLQAGLSVGQISIFVSTIYVAALIAQYPIGWISDRIDRRILIVGCTCVGGLGALLPFFLPGNFTIILIGAALIGGTSNPLYALLIAYCNDYLEKEDMAAASGGLLFINGVGAIAGPLILGWMMEQIGAEGFWLFSATLLLSIATYALFRMTRRTRGDMDIEQVSYTPVTAATTPIIAEIAQEVYIETEEEEAASAQ